MKNFWVEVEIDGRKTKLRGGPRGKTGGMKVRIFANDKEESKEIVTVNCYSKAGRLYVITETITNF